MEANLQQAKVALRDEVRSRLRTIPSGHLSSISKKICALMREQPIWSAAQSVLLFAPRPDEPNLWPLLHEALAAGKVVALPRFVSAGHGYAACEVRDPSRDLIAAKFYILEPTPSCLEFPLNRLDLALVPGVAFDLRGGRLGRGRGFYDRLLAAVRGTKCGVAFDEQMVSEIPVGPQDVRLNCILTPTRWIET